MLVRRGPVVGNNVSVFTDDRPREAPVPAVLSRAPPVVGNSEPESSESTRPVEAG